MVRSNPGVCRSKDEVGEAALKATLKKVQNLHEKKYLSDDPEDICIAYYPLLATLCGSTERISCKKFEKSCSDVFENSRQEIRTFSRAIQDAFNYIKGKASRMVDGSRGSASEEISKLMALQRSLQLRKPIAPAHAQVAKISATPLLPVKSSSCSSSVSSSNVKLERQTSILSLYGCEPDGGPYGFAQRSLKHNPSNVSSVVSISSGGSPSPTLPPKRLVADMTEVATPEASAASTDALEARTIKKAKVEVSVKVAKDRW